jgi:hypothetical protein
VLDVEWERRTHSTCKDCDVVLFGGDEDIDNFLGDVCIGFRRLGSGH